MRAILIPTLLVCSFLNAFADAPVSNDSAEIAAPVKIDSTPPVITSLPPAPQKMVSDTLFISNSLLAKLSLGGTVQLKAFYHNMFADRDADKKLSLNLRRLKLDLNGAVDTHAGFKAGLLLDANNRALGIDDGYLYYTVNEFVGFKGGKLKRPFSQEALQSSLNLYTVERGELYHDFIANTVGYAYYDLGLVAYGGFAEEGRTFGYEIGIFNGKQNDNVNGSYSGQHYEAQDKGFKAKDFVMRVTAIPINQLNLEFAVSTKAAEDTTNPDQFALAVNTGYEIGANYTFHQLKLLSEISWGDNQNKRDALIINGSSEYFAFYGTAVWHEDYKGGRASETVLKFEGLDPDFGWKDGEGKPNDGLLRYTFGSNYFFTPRTSVLVDYSVLQPITKIVGQKDLTQSLDVMWRLTF